LTSTLLYLVRHGEQQRSEDGGDDSALGLSSRGEQQARLLGQRLSGVAFDVVRHGPLRRAAETARIVASYLPGVPVASSDFLDDRTPVPPGDRQDVIPRQYRWFLDTIPEAERDPGAEQLEAAFAGLAVTGETGRCELLVTHGFVIGWFVRRVVDAPWWRWMSLSQANCALTIVRVTAGEPPALVAFNDTGHLAGPGP
jgi:serine/threonine-protein phosphatase PGAM5